MIKLIAAIDEARGIARTGQTPWYIKADLKHFRDLTMGHTILMGRKTYETIGHALPGRKNIIATRDPSYKLADCEVINDVVKYLRENREVVVWVIGGEEIFETALPLTDGIYLTRVQADYECDKHFPAFEKEFDLSEEAEWQQEGELRFRYQVWKRKPKIYNSPTR